MHATTKILAAALSALLLTSFTVQADSFYDPGPKADMATLVGVPATPLSVSHAARIRGSSIFIGINLPDLATAPFLNVFPSVTEASLPDGVATLSPNGVSLVTSTTNDRIIIQPNDAGPPL